MANAAIRFDREPYDASIPRPMGRNSAGEGFLRGFLAHGDVERFYLWNCFDRPLEELTPLIERLGPPARPVTWLEPGDRAGLAQAGAVFIPSPELQGEAWARRTVGGTAYSLTGVTHTIAETYVMGEIAGLLTAPLEPWDALICTSQAVRSAVQTQLEAVADHLHARLGAANIPPAQLVTIPLGAHTQDFAFDPEARRRWRIALDVPSEALAVLYFGRFSVATKMNPAPMGLALQRAAEQSSQAIHWILFGGSQTPGDEDEFRAAAAAFCPDVELRFVHEIDPNAHGPLWSAADVFLSLSDNVQESFGLTVIEAMAAGLPGVVSDWDGYRDTLRHGVDGFRIRTTAPRPGLGADLAFRYAHGLGDYRDYFAAQSQFTAVDVAAAADALAALAADADLRGRMGRAAAERAKSVFDWRAVIPQYQALWTELERRRRAAPAQPPRSGGDNPWGLDPFRMFAAYPTAPLSHADGVQLARALTPAELAELLNRPSVLNAPGRLPTWAEAEAMVAALSVRSPTPVGAFLQGFPPERRAFIERGLVWLAKYGVVRLSGDPPKG